MVVQELHRGIAEPALGHVDNALERKVVGRTVRGVLSFQGRDPALLASTVAQLIRGKHKPSFTPHMDGGDFVVVVNAEKVKLTGRKMDQFLASLGWLKGEPTIEEFAKSLK